MPKIYLRRSLQESIFMLFCYARAVITVVFGFKVLTPFLSLCHHDTRPIDPQPLTRLIDRSTANY